MEKAQKIVYCINDGHRGAFEVIPCYVRGKYDEGKYVEHGVIKTTGGRLSLVGIHDHMAYVSSKQEIFDKKEDAEFFSNYLKNAYKWGYDVATMDVENKVTKGFKELILGKKD